MPRFSHSIVRKPALAVATAALLGAAAATGAGAAERPATTGLPGTYAVVQVTVTDSGVTLSRKASHGVNVVAFVIHNRGSKTHDFRIGDAKSQVLRHGQTQDLPVNFEDFGVYRYRVTVHGTTKMHGSFRVLR
jgi:plastocyanin